MNIQPLQNSRLIICRRRGKSLPRHEVMHRRWFLCLTMLALLAVLIVSLAIAKPALALDGVYHNPYGAEDLYNPDAGSKTERFPHDPSPNNPVYIKASTWPIEPGQRVWLTWSKNGETKDQTINAAWKYNDGNNSYWEVAMGKFDQGDSISYTVHADINGTNQTSSGPFSFKATSWSWSNVTNVTGYTDNGDSVDITTGDSAGSFKPKLRFAFPTLDSFRLQLAPSGNGVTSSGSRSYTVSDSPDTLTISTSALVLKIQKSPYRLSVYKGDGTTLIAQEYDPAKFRNLGWFSDGSSTITRIEEHYLTPGGERFSGFGERYDFLDQSKHDVNNYVYNQYRNQGGTGRTYLSVPFFLNSGGYGIYLPSTYYSIFNIGTYRGDMAGFTVNTGGQPNSILDYYFFTGTPKNILNHYTGITTHPQLPPKWAFGLWMSANEWNTQDKVTDAMDKASANNIPATVVVLEQWSDEATFYIWHGAQYNAKPGSQKHSYADFKFNDSRWKDPKAMVDDAHSRGYKVILWQIPVFKQDFDQNPQTAPPQHINDRDYAAAQHYVVDDGSGKPYRIPAGWFGNSMVPDFTNPAATAWWMSKRDYLMDEVGIDGFKTDGSESIFGRYLTFADGRKGDEMHNAYPLSYTGVYNAYIHSKKNGNGAIFARAGTSGAQSNAIYWAGDQESTFAGFQEALRAGLSAGQSGIPFWTWDLAGFTGDLPSAELYLRATAMSTFAPVMQFHSENSNSDARAARTPWNIQDRTGNSNVIPIFRKFANVRMNLLPYIYTEAKRSADTGVPMMRAMSMEFPNDTTMVGLEQQYMFGEQLLVAPVITEGMMTKDVFVPEGEWYDFWNSGRFSGPGTKNYGTPWPWDSIPVYVRPGAIIPLNLNADYELGGNISNSVTNYPNLVFRIYPEGSSAYDYYDDAPGLTRTIQVTAAWDRHQVSITVPALTTAATLQVIATKPTRVTSDGTVSSPFDSLTALKAASAGWYWDPGLQATLIKLPANAVTRTVILDGVNKAAYEAEFADRVN